MTTTNQITRIKVAKCLASEILRKDENCENCPDSGCCVTINPELAALVEKCKKSEKTYEFSKEDSLLILEKYPATLKYESIESQPDIMGMRSYMIDYYYTTSIMPEVLSEKIVNKLENDEYSDEEIEALYAWSTRIYDIKLEERSKNP